MSATSTNVLESLGEATEPHVYGSGTAEFRIGKFKVQVGTNEHRTDGSEELALANALRERAVAVEATRVQATLAISVWRRACDERDATIARLERELADLRARHPKTPARIMATGCVRFDGPGKLWLLSKRETGWSAFGIPCADWDELFRRFNVRVTAHGTDEHGPWWAVENAA